MSNHNLIAGAFICGRLQLSRAMLVVEIVSERLSQIFGNESYADSTKKNSESFLSYSLQLSIRPRIFALKRKSTKIKQIYNPYARILLFCNHRQRKAVFV